VLRRYCSFGIGVAIAGTALVFALAPVPVSAQVTCVNPETKASYKADSECRMGEQMILPDFSAELRARHEREEEEARARGKKPSAKAGAKAAAKTVNKEPEPPPPPPPPPDLRPVADFNGVTPVTLNTSFADKVGGRDDWTLTIIPATRQIVTQITQWTGQEKSGDDAFTSNLDELGLSLQEPVTADQNQMQTSKYFGAVYLNLVCRAQGPCVREKYMLNGRIVDGGVVRTGMRAAFKTDADARRFIQEYFTVH